MMKTFDNFLRTTLSGQRRQHYLCTEIKNTHAMTKIGTPLTAAGKKALLCGSGELGKEVAIELQRYGVEVIAVDRYPDAPAMQVAHRSHVIDMLDGKQLRETIEREHHDIIIPEVEAIATGTLAELEKEGYTVVPTARAVCLTMNREGIRRLAAEELGLPTARYAFADTEEEFGRAVREIGIPCVVKPIMSSSGHGQSVVRSEADIREAWRCAREEANRPPSGRRRLPRIVAAAGHEPFGKGEGPRNSPCHNRSARRIRNLRSGDVRTR